eukprot:gene4956-21301_t
MESFFLHRTEEEECGDRTLLRGSIHDDVIVINSSDEENSHPYTPRSEEKIESRNNLTLMTTKKKYGCKRKKQSYFASKRPSCSHWGCNESEEDDDFVFSEERDVHQQLRDNTNLTSKHQCQSSVSQSKGLKRKKYRKRNLSKAKHVKRDFGNSSVNWNQRYETEEVQSGYDSDSEDDVDYCTSTCPAKVVGDTKPAVQSSAASVRSKEGHVAEGLASEDSDYPELDSDFEIDDPMFFRDDRTMPLPDFDPMIDADVENLGNANGNHFQQGDEPQNEEHSDEGYQSDKESLNSSDKALLLVPTHEGVCVRFNDFQAILPFINALQQRQLHNSGVFTIHHPPSIDQATRDFQFELQRAVATVFNEPLIERPSNNNHHDVIVIDSDSEDEFYDGRNLAEQQFDSGRRDTPVQIASSREDNDDQSENSVTSLGEIVNRAFLEGTNHAELEVGASGLDESLEGEQWLRFQQCEERRSDREVERILRLELPMESFRAQGGSAEDVEQRTVTNLQRVQYTEQKELGKFCVCEYCRNQADENQHMRGQFGNGAATESLLDRSQEGERSTFGTSFDTLSYIDNDSPSREGSCLEDDDAIRISQLFPNLEESCDDANSWYASQVSYGNLAHCQTDEGSCTSVQCEEEPTGEERQSDELDFALFGRFR